MKNICITFQIHQPFRLKNFHFFDIGSSSDYFDEKVNSEIMCRVVKKSYRPANKLLIDLIHAHGNKIKINFAISGTAIDQLEQYAPKMLESFIKLGKTDNVEILGQTYSNSLSSLKSEAIFKDEVLAHTVRIKTLFGKTPKVFLNTGLIYTNRIGTLVSKMGFTGILIDGDFKILKGKTPNTLYKNNSKSPLKIFLRNQSLSEDIAIRFPLKDWSEWPLTADKYLQWIRGLGPNEDLLNLVIDYATFGEHHEKETGIFSFLEYLFKYLEESKDLKLCKIQEVLKEFSSTKKLNNIKPISRTGTENNISPWLENDMQKEAIRTLYGLEKIIIKTKDSHLLKDFCYLQSADHFLYMGDEEDFKINVFNPYENQYDAYLRYMNVLSDFKLKIQNIIN